MSTTVKLDDIKIGDRARKDLGDVEQLAVSIQQFGLLYPIIIDREMNLIDGERRLRAHMALQLPSIEVIFKDEVDDVLRAELELETTIRRKQFTWQEEVALSSKILAMKQERLGKGKQGIKVGFGIRDLAALSDKSVGQTHNDLTLAKALEEFPELAKCKNKAAAMKMYQEMKTAQAVKVLVEKSEDFQADSRFIQGDCTIELPKLTAESVDMVLVDPPYGKDISIAKEAEGEEWDSVQFDDSKFNTKELLSTLLKESFRVLKPNRVMLVFFDVSLYQWLVDEATRVGFNVNKTPLVWHKTSGSGHPSHESHYVPSYELILHLQKGYRKISRTSNNLVPYDRVPSKVKTHPTQKPGGLIKLLIENHTQVGELVIDPCAGTGTTLRAAIDAKRCVWACELSSTYYHVGQTKLAEYLKARVESPVAESFTSLLPGTPEWKEFWKAHPEQQTAMLEFQKGLQK